MTDSTGKIRVAIFEDNDRKLETIMFALESLGCEVISIAKTVEKVLGYLTK